MPESSQRVESRIPAIRLVLVLFVCIAIATLTSRFVAYFLKIRIGALEYKLLADGDQKPFALAEGSSLMLDGLSWKRISEAFNQGIENWFVAGSSPSEWEPLQRRANKARLTFIVVSPYDLQRIFSVRLPRRSCTAEPKHQGSLAKQGRLAFFQAGVKPISFAVSSFSLSHSWPL